MEACSKIRTGYEIKTRWCGTQNTINLWLDIQHSIRLFCPILVDNAYLLKRHDLWYPNEKGTKEQSL